MTSSSDFLPTRWSLVLAAAGDPARAPASREALEQLARAYWYPLYAFIRRHGNTPEAAEDLAQEFFTTLLEKQFLAHANLHPSKGRFRAFLLASLKHFLANQYARQNALKRGGDRPPLSLDAAEARFAREPAAPADQSPERLFERHWALALLAQVLSQLEADYRNRGEDPLFQALKPTLTGGGPGLAQVAASLGMTEGALKTAAHRLRRRYRDLLRHTIAQTVNSPEEVEEEIAYLLNCL
jgi:RNA polymerase sigma-70 factor (ECF subfamily)